MKILFVDKVMAGVCREPPRGVELFNIRLLQELATQGEQIEALVHPSWEAFLGGVPGLVCRYPRVRGRVPAPAGVLALLRMVAGTSFDVLLLGNVANRLAGFVIGARWLRVCRNCLVIAHREPSRRVLWAQRVWPHSVIVAVNRQIATHFQQAGFASTAVYYGVTGAEAYLQLTRLAAAGAPVRFCVVGNLENAWKGADTAIAAFRAMPPAIRQHCELHLASYHQLPAFSEANIIPYGWMAAQEVPAFIGRMDVMLVPSRDEKVMRETFSQVMVQGMLAGLPQVTTPLPILAEKLDQGGGITAGDVAAMAAAMEKLAVSPALRKRLGAEARATAQARYIWNTQVFRRQFLRLCAGAINCNSSIDET